MTAPADPAAALVALLKADVAVSAIVGDLVFRPSLPEPPDRPAMPTACIVVTPAGGYVRYGGSMLKLVDPRIDVRCYGETDNAANQLAGTVAAVLRGTNSTISAGVFIKSMSITGPMPMVDPDSLWPFGFLTATVTHVEQPVS